MYKIFKNNKGITLVALVITIIVLLILAGIVISAIVNSGLISKLDYAKLKYLDSVENENDIFDAYLSIIDGDNVVTGSRTEAWNGATMLTIKISNITGGTFTINVNNVEANNYGTMYYYVNNTLVYSGTNSSYTVTEVNGNPIKDNTYYTVKVLAEPFEIGFTTGTGDNVDSWLACIGNSNENHYTIDNLDELFENETLIIDLLSNDEAFNYLMNSTEIIFPAFIEKIENDSDFTDVICSSSVFCNIVCSSTTYFENMCSNSEIFSKFCENANWRNSMYNNYSITESILAKSTTALEVMKKSSQYEVVSYSGSIDSSTSSYWKLYNGKAFVLGISQNCFNRTTRTTYHGLYVNGDSTLTIVATDTYGTTGLTYKINKFASEVRQHPAPGANRTGTSYAAIFKI